MASILSAGTTNSTALNLTADTSGSLILASNNNVTAVTIATNQNVTFANNATFPTTIGVGGATPSASGSGISFPATQSASSDANTLDDYEEGTWTPTIFGGTTAGSTTYSNQTGTYTKIGRVVYFFVDVQWTAQSGTGDLTMGGLPFTCGSSIGQNSYASNNLALSANQYTSLAQVNASATTVNFYQNQTGGSALTGVPVDSSARIWMGGCYFTA